MVLPHNVPTHLCSSRTSLPNLLPFLSRRKLPLPGIHLRHPPTASIGSSQMSRFPLNVQYPDNPLTVGCHNHTGGHKNVLISNDRQYPVIGYSHD